MNSFCLLAALLQWSSRVLSAAVIDVRSIPSQSVQLLQSGDSTLLLCTVTTNTVTTVQWFNGSTPLVGNGDGVIITLPYRLNNATWQAAMEIVVLTVHSSGWYYCKPDELGFGSVQLNVHDSGEDSSLLLSHSVFNLYATVPFTVNCSSSLPMESQLQMEVSWYRGVSEVLSLASSFSTSVSTKYINSTTIESQLTMTEPVPSLGVQYRCVLKAFTLDTIIYTLDKSTPTLQIQAAPSITLTLESTPAGGPLLDHTYILTCTSKSLVNMSSMRSLEWKNSDGTPVLSGGNLAVGEVLNGEDGSSVSLTFSKVSKENEGVYSCHGSMELHEYPNNPPIENTVSETVEAPVQVTSVGISPLPSNTLDWYEGGDAALICTIQTNKLTAGDLVVEWHNSLSGTINSSSGVVSLSDTVHQSILELQSLSVHDGVYYCRASMSGAGVKQDWHYVNVESDLPSIEVIITHSSMVTALAGMPHSLYCSHDKQDSIDGQPSLVSWIHITDLADSVIKQDLLHIVTDLVDNGTHFVSELHFVSVDYTDAGEYTCEIEYNFFGSLPNVLRSDTDLLEVQVAPPTVTVIAASQGGIECTVQLINTIVSSPLPLAVTVTWHLTNDSNTSVAASSIPGIMISNLSVLECYKMYESFLMFSNSDIREQFKSISCEVNVSVDKSYVISSSSVATLDLQSLPDRSNPRLISNVTIKDTGSRWAEILWISSFDNVTAGNFQVEYWRNGEDSAVKLPVQRIFSALEDDGAYSAVVTDLSPAVEYSVRVSIVQNGADVNKSATIKFTTDEAVPTGIPLNLSRSGYSHNGGVLLQWNSPKADERNGVITGYIVLCEPSLSLNQQHENETFIHPRTNVSLYGLVVGTVYVCRVAAVNKEGVGPQTSLQFSLSTDDGTGAVAEHIALWEWNSYSFVVAGVLGIVLLVVIVSLAVSVCYYKRKLRLYFQHVCKRLPSSPSDSLNRRDNSPRDSSDAQSARYVPSDTIDSMLERAHRYTAFRRQSSTAPLQQELKQMETEL